jgi:hypothetical protein
VHADSNEPTVAREKWKVCAERSDESGMQLSKQLLRPDETLHNLAHGIGNTLQGLNGSLYGFWQ